MEKIHGAECAIERIVANWDAVDAEREQIFTGGLKSICRCIAIRWLR
jgi:hypothetical protein